MRLALPFHTVTTVAHFWGTQSANLVLREEVGEWLAEHDMSFTIEYVEDGFEVDYYIRFTCASAAVSFKLRWC